MSDAAAALRADADSQAKFAVGLMDSIKPGLERLRALHVHVGAELDDYTLVDMAATKIETLVAAWERQVATIVASEWWPIESAPKDGTKFIAWGVVARRIAPGDSIERTPAPVAHVMMWRAYRGEFWGDWVSTSLDTNIAQLPTHWMPIPAPPQEQTDDH